MLTTGIASYVTLKIQSLSALVSCLYIMGQDWIWGLTWHVKVSEIVSIIIQKSLEKGPAMMLRALMLCWGP